MLWPVSVTTAVYCGVILDTLQTQQTRHAALDLAAWINNLPYSPIFDRGIIREKSWLPGKVLGIKLHLLLLVSKLSKLPIALYYSSPLLSVLNTLK